MAQSSDFLLCIDDCATTVTVRARGQTGVLTVRSNSLVNDFIVTQRVNCLSIGVVTVGAGVGRHACVQAVGSLGLLAHIVVAQSCDFFLYGQNCVTDRAVRAFGQAGSSTGRRNSCVDNHGVRQLVDCNLCAAHLFTTDGTVNNLVVRTGGIAGCVLLVLLHSLSSGVVVVAMSNNCEIVSVRNCNVVFCDQRCVGLLIEGTAGQQVAYICRADS